MLFGLKKKNSAKYRQGNTVFGFYTEPLRFPPVGQTTLKSCTFSYRVCVCVYKSPTYTHYFKTLNWMGIFEFQLNAPGAIKSDCEHLRNSTFFQTVHQTCASKTHTGLSSPFINSTDDWVLHLFERGTKEMLDPTYVTACLCSSSIPASFCSDLSHRRWPARARLEMHWLPRTPAETVRVCEAQQRLE